MDGGTNCPNLLTLPQSALTLVVMVYVDCAFDKEAVNENETEFLGGSLHRAYNQIRFRKRGHSNYVRLLYGYLCIASGQNL